MCIDSQMLSAYLDGELKEPYKAQVEEHLEHCAACRRHLEEMMALDRRIREADFPDELLLRSKDRIFGLLDSKYFQNGRKVSFMRRRLEISLPSLITAAAAVVFIIIGGFIFFGAYPEQTEDILPSFQLQADPGSVHFVSDSSSLDNFTLEEILQYLDSKGYNVDISIKGLQPLETETESTPEAVS